MLVGYARVSTADQDPEHQARVLRERGCERVFRDRCPGRVRDRPQLKAALDFLRAGDSLVVWRFDRLGRSVPHVLEIAQDLERRGCQLVSLTEAIDTGTPGGRMVFTVFAALAEMEAELARERTALAVRTARAEGRRWGRPSIFHDEETVRIAKALLADPAVSTAEAALVPRRQPRCVQGRTATLKKLGSGAMPRPVRPAPTLPLTLPKSRSTSYNRIHRIGPFAARSGCGGAGAQLQVAARQGPQLGWESLHHRGFRVGPQAGAAQCP